MGKFRIELIKIKFKIWRVTFFFKSFFTIKEIWDELLVFMQETIYQVRTEMRQSLGRSKPAKAKIDLKNVEWAVKLQKI